METNKTAAERREEHRKRMEERMARFAANGRTHPHREHPRPAMTGSTHPHREHPFMAHLRKKAEENVERGGQ